MQKQRRKQREEEELCFIQRDPWTISGISAELTKGLNTVKAKNQESQPLSERESLETHKAHINVDEESIVIF